MIERDLVEKLARGDEEAARAFVRSTQYAVMSTLRRFRQLSREDVEDLFQEVFGRLFANGCRVLQQANVRNLPAYLRRIARNTAIDHLRGRKQLPEADPVEEADDLASGTDDPEAEAVLNELRRMMLEAIHRLAPPDHEVIVAVDVEQKTYEEAAAELNITRNNLGVRLNRARNRLARIVETEYPALLAHLRNWM